MQMKVYAANGTSRFLLFLQLGFMFFICIIIGLMVLRLSPVTSGGNPVNHRMPTDFLHLRSFSFYDLSCSMSIAPGYIGILMVRVGFSQIYQEPFWYNIARIFGQCLLVYTLIAAKVFTPPSHPWLLLNATISLI